MYVFDSRFLFGILYFFPYTCSDKAKQETLWEYSLGCLNQFIDDDALKEAFPSADPDLLAIPKGKKTEEEPTAKESAKKEGGPDEKRETEEPLAGGETSSGQEQTEKLLEEALASGAVEVHPETPKTSEEPEAEKSKEDESSEAEVGGISEKQVEERPTEDRNTELAT